MGKDVDLSEGEPVYKDPPLHRAIDWIENSCGWGSLIVLALWAAAIPLIILPLIGVINGWSQTNGNAAASLVIGCIVGLAALIGTGFWIWDLEEQKIRKRRNMGGFEHTSSDLQYHYYMNMRPVQQAYFNKHQGQVITWNGPPQNPQVGP